MKDGNKNISLDTQSGYYSIKQYCRGWVRSGFDWRTKPLELYFSQGSAHTEPPTLADVLDCLASDAAGYNQAGGQFEEWCSEYGYDSDSRKAEKTFRAVQQQARDLKALLGNDAYEELLFQTERL